MLAELILNLLTPASSRDRSLGLVNESVGVWSRGRRQRREWAEHERRCHAVVRRAMEGLPARRKAVVLGSGFLRDIPFDEMRAAFDEVVLIDAVHPPQTRWRSRRFDNVTLVARDLSGVLGWMTGEGEARIDPLADMRSDPAVDFVVSANLLSQLPIRPEEWLESHPRHAARLPADFIDSFISWHLADLAAFSCRICLLTDVAMIGRDRGGEEFERVDLMRGHKLPQADESWDWTVAPFGELERDRAFIHRVHGYADFNRAALRVSEAPGETTMRNHGALSGKVIAA